MNIKCLAGWHKWEPANVKRGKNFVGWPLTAVSLRCASCSKRKTETEWGNLDRAMLAELYPGYFLPHVVTEESLKAAARETSRDCEFSRAIIAKGEKIPFDSVPPSARVHLGELGLLDYSQSIFGGMGETKQMDAECDVAGQEAVAAYQDGGLPAAENLLGKKLCPPTV